MSFGLFLEPFLKVIITGQTLLSIINRFSFVLDIMILLIFLWVVYPFPAIIPMSSNFKNLFAKLFSNLNFIWSHYVPQRDETAYDTAVRTNSCEWQSVFAVLSFLEKERVSNLSITPVWPTIRERLHSERTKNASMI